MLTPLYSMENCDPAASERHEIRLLARTSVPAPYGVEFTKRRVEGCDNTTPSAGGPNEETGDGIFLMVLQISEYNP